LDFGAAGAAAAAIFPADFPVAPGDGLTGGGLDVPFAAAGLIVSSSSELDADSELLSLSCKKKNSTVLVQLNSTVQNSQEVSSVVDPHWCHFLSQCGSSGSREPSQCESGWIRILVRLSSHKQNNFYMKNILKVPGR
jgi:hypothetical protein